MKKIILFVASFATLVSCVKDVQTPVGKVDISDGDCFVATLDNSYTRTNIDGFAVNWQYGDSISINGVIFKAHIISGRDSSIASFKKAHEEDITPVAPFTAYFPASLYDSTTKCASLPDTIEYLAGRFNMPMYAQSSSEKVLNFSNICGVLKISIDDSISVESLSVKADTVMSGKFTVSNGAAVLDVTGPFTAKDSAVVVKFATTPSDTVFYVPVVPGDYSGKQLRMSVTPQGGKKQIMATNKNASVLISKNTIYPFKHKQSVLPNYFCISAREANVTVSMAKKHPSVSPDVNFKYSTDGYEWHDYKYDEEIDSKNILTLSDTDDKVYLTAGQGIRNFSRARTIIPNSSSRGKWM